MATPSNSQSSPHKVIGYVGLSGLRKRWPHLHHQLAQQALGIARHPGDHQPPHLRLDPGVHQHQHPRGNAQAGRRGHRVPLDPQPERRADGLVIGDLVSTPGYFRQPGPGVPNPTTGSGRWSAGRSWPAPPRCSGLARIAIGNSRATSTSFIAFQRQLALATQPQADTSLGQRPTRSGQLLLRELELAHPFLVFKMLKRIRRVLYFPGTSSSPQGRPIHEPTHRLASWTVTQPRRAMDYYFNTPPRRARQQAKHMQLVVARHDLTAETAAAQARVAAALRVIQCLGGGPAHA
ncbi:hypothetical protein L1887_57429 [Cichorium endivia]|nr:hypothetical protein L1887_57429 [Cichorium endivia]